MKKQMILTIAIAAISCAVHAQTKLIAHRSHGGSAATFRTSGDDNFGVIRYEPRPETPEPVTLPVKQQPQPQPKPSPNYPKQKQQPVVVPNQNQPVKK